MKNSFVLVLATAFVLSFAAGCKTNTRTTPLPTGANGSATGARTQPDLSTTPFNTFGDGASLTAVTPGAPGELADDTVLDGRDQDRTRFAAQTVYFEFDRSNVLPAEASKIEQVAGAFKALSADHDLLIEGHCDERGTEEYNRALGERRALAIRELLVNSGVDAARVHTKSFGEDRPAELGHDELAWGKNRRGEFILVLPRKIITTQAE